MFYNYKYINSYFFSHNDNPSYCREDISKRNLLWEECFSLDELMRVDAKSKNELHPFGEYKLCTYEPYIQSLGLYYDYNLAGRCIVFSRPPKEENLREFSKDGEREINLRLYDESYEKKIKIHFPETDEHPCLYGKWAFLIVGGKDFSLDSYGTSYLKSELKRCFKAYEIRY